MGNFVSFLFTVSVAVKNLTLKMSFSKLVADGASRGLFRMYQRQAIFFSNRETSNKRQGPVPGMAQDYAISNMEDSQA